MKITIQGEDYTSALDAAQPLTIERKLNEPSVCLLWLCLPSGGTLSAPSRNQSLNITGDDGTCYFTGYVAVTPQPEYAGLGIEGPRYRLAIQAVSDEILLDQLSVSPSKGSTGQTAGSLITSLVTRTGSTSLSTQAVTLNAPVSSFVPDAGAPWSKSAGQVASLARAAYRAVNGVLALSSVPGAVHVLNETGGTLNLANLSLTATAKRALANDITVCGAHEPVAYATEYFLGDGVTTQFNLAFNPYFPPSSRLVIIRELFNESAIDPRMWANLGGSGYLSLGPGGLAMRGGNGTDGDTLLTWLDTIEMGGTLLLEACGVTLAPGSTGILPGFFTGLETLPGCTAGFQATALQGSGAVTLQPVVMGAACGTTYAVNPAYQYSLRVRVHCPEVERALAVYRSYGENGAVTYGGQSNTAPARLQFEIQEYVNGVAGMPVTLYDGSIASLPAACMVVAASSINLVGTMRALNLTSLGSGWVVSTPANGTPVTRRIGTAAESAECYLESTGKLVFYTGFAPPVGEQIAVSYRTVGRAVGRAVNAASQQALALAGSPSVATWIGEVLSPPARSSQDCRNAAQAMEQAAASVSALWSGAYKGTQASFAADVWPGDALQLTAPSTGINTQVVVRTVKISYRASYPDQVNYAIAFANDWADDLAIKTSATVPDDTWLPAPVTPAYLTNLNGLTVTAMTGSTVTINTGATAPTGGGFEIRRRDFCFMPGEDPDLVMRGSQPNMTFT
ncbi:MAG: hypothetical protein WCA11_09410, partial [Terracidiphilus sp.]